MPLTVDELRPVVDQLLALYQKERHRLDLIAGYMANKVDDIYVPRAATTEYRRLVDQARFNVLPLVVSAVAQNLFVDGYRPTGPSGRAPSSDNAPIWDAVWQANRMDARQAGIYRPAITYGYSYALVLPGKLDNEREDPVPVITPYSPRQLTALYADPVNDEWPLYAMVARRPLVAPAETYSDPLAEATTPDGVRLTVYDEAFRYEVTKTPTGWVLDADAAEHGLGVCPVVRFLDEIADHLPVGKVEPLLPAQRQLNQTTFNLLMAQQYAAFRQRWVTGMAIPEDANGSPVEPFNAAVNRVWQSDSPDTKFGDFQETNLSGYLESRDKLLLYISAMAQIPPHQLLIGSGISNISAEALAALEAGHRHDIDEHQTSFGESIEQMLRLAALAMGDDAGWEDQSAQVVWRDTTPRSLGQVADALGKLAQMLGVPTRALWERIPGVTDQDIARWTAMSDDQQLMAELSSMLNPEAPQNPEVAGGEPAGTAPDLGAPAAARPGGGQRPSPS